MLVMQKQDVLVGWKPLVKTNMKKQHVKNPEKWEEIRKKALTRLYGRRANKYLSEPVSPLLINAPKTNLNTDESLKCDKIKYESEKDAYKVKMQHKKPKTMRVYYCTICKCYHLTHRKKLNY